MRSAVAVAELARSYRPADDREVLRPLTKAAESLGVPAHKAERMVREVVRKAAHDLMLDCKAVAQEPDGRNVFQKSAEVQDADHVATKLYSRFATIMGNREGDLLRYIGDFARTARIGALQEYARRMNDGSDREILQLAAEGWVARAVFGVESGLTGAVPVLSFLGGGKFAGTLPSAAGHFTPPIVVGYYHYTLIPGRNGPEVWATGRVNALLKSIDGTAVARAKPDDNASDAFLSGRFELETGRDGITKARIPMGHNYLYAPAVPLSEIPLKHVALTDLSPGDHYDVIQMLSRERYDRVPSSTKKSEHLGRAVAVDKYGYIKWARPDPFASARKK